MKPIRIVLSPTHSRPLNIFLGMVLVLVSLLLFLALATYHATDPSLNTATDSIAPRNWIGLFGAYLADLLFQSLGLTAFLIPLWMAAIGWTWMHSRPGGSPVLRWMGTLLALVFLPAVLGLLPWHWRWLHAIPIEGVVGRLIAGLLVVYLNIQGAWLVAIALAGCGIYFASAISFSFIRETIADRWMSFAAWRDRWRSRREERAELRAERKALREERDDSVDFAQFARESSARSEAESPDRPRHRFLGFLFRRRRALDEDPLDAIPAFRREPLGQTETAIPITQRKPSIWERGAEPRTIAASPSVPPSAFDRAQPLPPNPQPQAELTIDQWLAAPVPEEPAPPTHLSGDIAIHSRADAVAHAVTVAPKNVSGFKLPSSGLLSEGEGPQSVREDELRDEAKVLVEKCAEFDVRGQVVQINPGPMVTTFEFKPEAGVKYSRVTGLADDLCLAMRAESILIERMPGKSTVGIQVPNRERETIRLREFIESETFARARSRLTLSMGKTSTAALSPPILPRCLTFSSRVPRAQANPWPSTA